MAKKHVFLSYCRDNADAVRWLYSDLTAAGEPIWWDQDILPGQDWKLEIRKAMRDAYAVVLCLSAETADRITTGVYPEVLDAIRAYREYAPGSVFLIPVRLSECELPFIEIDDTRSLDRLQFLDLFPAEQRDANFQKLIRALRAAPHHPLLAEATSPSSPAAPAPTVTPPPQPVPAASPSTVGAVDVLWQKLAFLLEQEVIATDAAQKFALKKQIEECLAKIAEFEGQDQTSKAQSLQTPDIEEILDVLTAMFAAQFERVVFSFDVNNVVPGKTASQSDRAIELARLARSDGEAGLKRLWETIQRVKGRRP